MDLPARRLQSLLLAGSSEESPAKIVSRLGGLQGQDFAGAKWSIALRSRGLKEADIDQAFAKKQIVRSWLMRGTLHLASAADLRWILSLTASRNIRAQAGRHRQLGLDEKTFAKSHRILARELSGAAPKTRSALYQLLNKNKISTEGQRGIHLLWRAAQEGLLCFATHEEKQPAFALLEEWVPKATPLPREKALAELARRYFGGRGPATVKDFSWWSGLAPADARAGLEAVQNDFENEIVAGKTFWFSKSKTKLDRPAALALPGFDEYLLGYQNRSAVLDPKHASKICPGGNGVFFPTIVLNGKVAGTWKREIRKDVVRISATLFAAATQAEKRAFAEAAERYASYLGMRSSLTWSGK